MLDYNKKIGIALRAKELGNCVMWTHLPENFYKCYGKKLVDIEKHWVFDYNPYVERDTNFEIGFDLNIFDSRDALYFQMYGRNLPVVLSRPDEDCNRLGIFDVNLRHPRLYQYEDIPKKLNKICLHISSTTKENVLPPYENEYRYMPQHVIEHILEKYSNYEIVQIGGQDDPLIVGIENKMNLSYWELSKEIAECNMFIGIDSGPMNIAACYPSVNKKIVLNQFPIEYLKSNFYPMSSRFKHHQWFDWSSTFYNCDEDDAGVTFSYTKI